MKTLLHTLVLLFLCSINCLSQTDQHHLHTGINNEHIDTFYLKLENDPDSVLGFDT